MQQTSVDRTVRYLVVLVMVSALALLACSGNNETRNIDTTSSPTLVNSTTVAAVQDLVLTITNGAVFHAGIGANPVELIFGSASTFTLTRGNSSASGTVAFGSCTFTFTSSFPPGQGPQAGDTVNFPTCVFIVQADDVEVGGDSVAGMLILMLTNDAGARTDNSVRPLTVDVSIRSDGELFVTNPGSGVNVDTGVDTDVTGTTR